MIVLACGDTKWNNPGLVMRWLAWLRPTGLVEGEARGADIESRIAAQILNDLGACDITIHRFPADWDTHKRAAGPIRNQQQLDALVEMHRDSGQNIYGLAFHEDIQSSKGTKDMVTRLLKLGIPTVVVSGPNEHAWYDHIAGKEGDEPDRPTSSGPRVLNRKTHGHPKGAVYVGRGSRWGNPFKIGRDGTREEVIERFHHDLLGHENWREEIAELRGKDLVCWCAPEPCHADILLSLANYDPEKGE